MYRTARFDNHGSGAMHQNVVGFVRLNDIHRSSMRHYFGPGAGGSRPVTTPRLANPL
jgi:hypothetical protein